MMMMMRWQSFVSCKTWGAKFDSPVEMIRFSWEDEDKSEIPTDEEIERIRRELQMENGRLRG
jgi:hypothetical protein